MRLQERTDSVNNKGPAILIRMTVVSARIFKNPWSLLGLFLSVIVVIGLGMFVVQTVKYVGVIRAGGPNPFESSRVEAKVTQILARPTTVDTSRIESRGRDPMIGNPEAPIRIVEFVDYQCPFCARSHDPLRAFVARHPDDVLLIIRDFPLESIHPSAFTAARAARCVFAQEQPNLFWAYHGRLFANQTDLSETALRQHAQAVGANVKDFDRCLFSSFTEPEVRASIDDGVAVGVRGTPTFFFNQAPVQGAVDLETLEELFRQIKKKI